jgi:uncharacterized protein
MMSEDSFEIDSHIVGDRFAVTLARMPGESPPGQTPQHVVYVLDSILTLGPTVAAAQMLGTAALITGASFPALTIAGVGYATDDPGEIFGRRFRDLTPTARGAPEGIGLPTNPPGAGGAPRFLEALAEEIIPSVEARLGEIPSSRALVGISLSGLFGLYALFHPPEAEVFDRYLLVSPSIWWDGAIGLRFEQEWAQQHQDLPVRVFLGVGAQEQDIADVWLNERASAEALEYARLVDHVRTFEAHLQDRGYPGLRLDAVVFEGEYHFSVFPAAVTRGLLALYSEDLTL